MTQAVMNGDSTRIHPTAVVDPKAQIDVGVDIGPYAVVGPEVSIGSGTRIGPCLLYTSPSPRDGLLSRMPSSA